MKVLVLLIFYFLCGLSAEDLDERYESMLQEAEYYLQKKNISVTSLKLQKIQARFEELDYRFYTLLGDLFVLEGRNLDALVVYTKSLELKPDQPKVAKFLYQVYLENKDPKKAFDVLRIYLSQTDKDLEARYKSLVLASRLGEKKYYQFALKKIKNFIITNPKDLEQELNKLLKQKNWKDLLEKSKQAYYQFPENPIFYKYAQIAQTRLDPNSSEMEEILLSMAAIFQTEKKYDIQLAQYYQQQGRSLEALNLYRRAFWHSLQIDKFNFEEDTLFLLRDVYYNLGWHKEALEISELVEMIRKKRDLEILELENRIRVTQNREMLVYIIFFAKQTENLELAQKYKLELKKRDEINWLKDFTGIFPVFLYEEIE